MARRSKFPSLEKKKKFPDISRSNPKTRKFSEPPKLRNLRNNRNRTKRAKGNGNSSLECRIDNFLDNFVSQYAPIPIYSTNRIYR